MRGLIGKLAVLVAMIWATCANAAADDNPWGQNYFPNLPVVTQDGKTLKFYDDVIKGKQVVVSFIYTTCPDVCPLTTARLAMVKDQLGEAMGRDVFFVSMTVDPETDTQPRMKAFADAFNTGPGWLFLTGKPEDIRAINRRLGNNSEVLSEHRYEIILGNDVTGDWQRDSPFGDIATITYNIRGMSPKLSATNMAATAGSNDESVVISDRPGETLFRKICTPCHTVGVGNRVGPDLRDVAARRTDAWLEAFIANPAKVRASGDPVALQLNGEFPGVKMPALGLTPTDVQDLITYLKAATARLEPPPELKLADHDHTKHHHDHSKMALPN